MKRRISFLISLGALGFSASMVSAMDFTISGATWTFQNNFNYSTIRTISIPSGSLVANGSQIQVQTGWSAPAGAFQAGTSTVTITGDALIQGQTTFSNLLANTPGQTLTFQMNSTQTVSGVLTLQGASGNRLNVRSSAGTAYLASTGSQSVQHVDAQNNNASGGNTILAGTTSNDSGGNTNWLFVNVSSPTGFTGTALGVSSIAWSWNATPGAVGYRMVYSTSPSTVVADLGLVLSTDTINLSTNTAYNFSLQAQFGTSLYGPLSTATTTYTHAAVPNNFTLPNVWVTSMTFAWGNNTNPSPTLYQVDYALNDSLFASFLSTQTTSLSSLATGLAANTTYYMRLSALNGDGIQTAFTSAISTITLPAIPISGSIDTVTDVSFRVTWAANGNNPSTVYQAEISTISLVGASTATILTTSLEATFSGLQTGTTYYARVRANGFGSTNSAFLYIGSAYPNLPIPNALSFSNVQIDQLTVNWVGVVSSTISYEVTLAEGNPFATPVVVSTPTLTTTFVGLSTNTVYFARVRTQSLTSGFYSSYSNTISTYTLADVATNLSTTSVTASTIGLQWQLGTNPSGTLFELERSTSGVTYTRLIQQTSLTYGDSGLSGGTTYYYRVRALNGNSVPTAYTPDLIVVTLSSSTSLSPKTICGWGASFANATQLDLSWNATTLRTDGSAVGTISGYELYRSTAATLPKAQWTFVGLVATSTTSVTVIPGTTRYYALRAVDSFGNPSDWSTIIDDSSELSLYTVVANEESYFRIPMSAAQSLRSQNNSYGTDLCVSASVVSSEEGSRVVRSIRFDLSRLDTGAEVQDFVFSPAVAEGVLHYNLSGGQVSIGAPGAFATGVQSADAASRLSLYWNTGNEWVKSTATVDPLLQQVRFQTGRLGRYQIRIATHAGLTLTQVYPRIFTPNGDGWNDKVIFMFDNPNGASLSGEIFDISGTSVAKLSEGPVPDASLSWDGKRSGQTVPGGIYLYELNLSGKTVTGTVVVAR